MSENNSFSHLTLEERRIILTGISNGSTKTAIALTIGKDKSTAGREIKLHRILSHKCSLPLECVVYRKCVHVLLTDRGTEFSSADAMEISSDGSRHTRVFFCNPMQDGQKGSLENKHVELRYIFPHGTDLHAPGLVCQQDLNLVLSHVNLHSGAFTRQGESVIKAICDAPAQIARRTLFTLIPHRWKNQRQKSAGAGGFPLP